MVYVCEQVCCHYTFEHAAEPQQCPECGGRRLRPARALQAFREEKNYAFEQRKEVLL